MTQLPVLSDGVTDIDVSTEGPMDLGYYQQLHPVRGASYTYDSRRPGAADRALKTPAPATPPHYCDSGIVDNHYLYLLGGAPLIKIAYS
ncbi:hypothetical protein FOXYSP1_20278 [Fusarium oxysporum f. sp. phaseoli]